MPQAFRAFGFCLALAWRLSLQLGARAVGGGLRHPGRRSASAQRPYCCGQFRQAVEPMPPLEQWVTFPSEGVLTADVYSTHNVKAFEGVIPPVAKTNQRGEMPIATWDCEIPAKFFPAWCLEAVTDPDRHCCTIV